MVDDMNALLSTFLTFFALDEIERTGLRAMAVIVLIESRIALKPERLPLVGGLTLLKRLQSEGETGLGFPGGSQPCR